MDRIEKDMANGRGLSLVYKTRAINISFIGQRTARPVDSFQS